MKQTIEIDVPKGMKAVYNKIEQKIEFVPSITCPDLEDIRKKINNHVYTLEHHFPVGINESLIALLELWAARHEFFKINNLGITDENHLPYYITRESRICVGNSSDIHPVLKFPTLETAQKFSEKYRQIIYKFYNGIML